MSATLGPMATAYWPATVGELNFRRYVLPPRAVTEVTAMAPPGPVMPTSAGVNVERLIARSKVTSR